MGTDKVLETKYILRPELIESLFYLFRITGKKIHKDRAWKIFESLDAFCKVCVSHLNFFILFQRNGFVFLGSEWFFWFV